MEHPITRTTCVRATTSVSSKIYEWIKALQTSILLDDLNAHAKNHEQQIAIIFNGSNYPESVLAHVAKTQNLATVYVESGFFPGTLQIDSRGINAANSVPRDPKFYQRVESHFSAHGLPTSITSRKKKIVGGKAVKLNPGYIFVPFQVPTDMQITVHSPWVRNMEQFLDVVIAAANRNLQETFVIKEHPSYKISVKRSRSPHSRVVFANDNATSQLIENSRAVLTINSTVGIEGLLLGKPIITLGASCYDINGLVKPAQDSQSLDAAISATRTWLPEDDLRREYLGFLWNEYLTHASYDKLPPNFGERLRQISRSFRSPASENP